MCVHVVCTFAWRVINMHQILIQQQSWHNLVSSERLVYVCAMVCKYTVRLYV